jgi:hypothetical protein
MFPSKIVAQNFLLFDDKNTQVSWAVWISYIMCCSMDESILGKALRCGWVQ